MESRKGYDWVEKYRPRSLAGVVGHPKGIEELVSWAQSWRRGIPKDKAVLLYGKAGVGKTSAAYALANDMRWDVVELNASDQRTAKIVDKIAGAASQNSILNIEDRTNGLRANRLVILDEADNLHGNADRGGEKAIIELIKKTTQPIILTANEYYDMSIGLRNACLPIQFSGIKTGTVIGILRKIADAEGVICGMGVLETIADNSNGDLRGAINDLQAIAEGKGRDGRDDVKIKLDINDVKNGTGERDFKENIFKVLDKIFKGTDYIDAYESTFGLDQNPEDLINWIDENIPLEYIGIEELDRGFDYLSRASLFLGRTRRRQDYDMWRYAGFLMSGGVTVAKVGKHGGYTKFQTPSYWQKLGQARGRRGIRESVAKKIGKKCHLSSAYVKSDLFHFFKTLMRDERFNVSVAASLGLEKEEIAFLLDSDIKSEKINNIYDHAKLIIEEEKEHDIEMFGGFTIKTERKLEERKKDISVPAKSIVPIIKASDVDEDKGKAKKQISLIDFQKRGSGSDDIKFYDELFKLISGGIASSKKGEIAAPIEAIISEAKKYGIIGIEKDLVKKIETDFKTRNISTEITKNNKFLVFKRGIGIR